ncbi:Chromo domain protein [Pseudocohnilembus persalinus]|uniref:Chromo domain protein n=1 Tax=Pseudocohnilembus persalinus TaxID=266149 RepID=A0A0V0QRX0_PSEPJ|nr:Chromo domain protein [Pseudocohnilembus persalinus]|eukprot:KRX05043.1 Chromo domain protein [Pseudocohnilembus persalinus]
MYTFLQIQINCEFSKIILDLFSSSSSDEESDLQNKNSQKNIEIQQQLTNNELQQVHKTVNSNDSNSIIGNQKDHKDKNSIKKNQNQHKNKQSIQKTRILNLNQQFGNQFNSEKKKNKRHNSSFLDELNMDSSFFTTENQDIKNNQNNIGQQLNKQQNIIQSNSIEQKKQRQQHIKGQEQIQKQSNKSQIKLFQEENQESSSSFQSSENSASEIENLQLIEIISEDEEEQYEIDEIVQKTEYDPKKKVYKYYDKIDRKFPMYQVHWTGYDDSENQWRHLEELRGCIKTVEKFEAIQKKRERKRQLQQQQIQELQQQKLDVFDRNKRREKIEQNLKQYKKDDVAQNIKQQQQDSNEENDQMQQEFKNNQKQQKKIIILPLELDVNQSLVDFLALYLQKLFRPIKIQIANAQDLGKKNIDDIMIDENLGKISYSAELIAKLSQEQLQKLIIQEQQKNYEVIQIIVLLKSDIRQFGDTKNFIYEYHSELYPNITLLSQSRFSEIIYKSDFFSNYKNLVNIKKEERDKQEMWNKKDMQENDDMDDETIETELIANKSCVLDKFWVSHIEKKWSMPNSYLIQKAMPLFLDLIVKTIFGLEQCEYKQCTLNPCENKNNNFDELLQQSLLLCPVCMFKLSLVLKFDVKERYRSLHNMFDQAQDRFQVDFSKQLNITQQVIKTIKNTNEKNLKPQYKYQNQQQNSQIKQQELQQSQYKFQKRNQNVLDSENEEFQNIIDIIKKQDIQLNQNKNLQQQNDEYNINTIEQSDLLMENLSFNRNKNPDLLINRLQDKYKNYKNDNPFKKNKDIDKNIENKYKDIKSDSFQSPTNNKVDHKNQLQQQNKSNSTNKQQIKNQQMLQSSFLEDDILFQNLNQDVQQQEQDQHQLQFKIPSPKHIKKQANQQNNLIKKSLTKKDFDYDQQIKNQSSKEKQAKINNNNIQKDQKSSQNSSFLQDFSNAFEQKINSTNCTFDKKENQISDSFNSNIGNFEFESQSLEQQQQQTKLNNIIQQQQIKHSQITQSQEQNQDNQKNEVNQNIVNNDNINNTISKNNENNDSINNGDDKQNFEENSQYNDSDIEIQEDLQDEDSSKNEQNNEKKNLNSSSFIRNKQDLGHTLLSKRNLQNTSNNSISIRNDKKIQVQNIVDDDQQLNLVQQTNQQQIQDDYQFNNSQNYNKENQEKDQQMLIEQSNLNVVQPNQQDSDIDVSPQDEEEKYDGNQQYKSNEIKLQQKNHLSEIIQQIKYKRKTQKNIEKQDYKKQQQNDYKKINVDSFSITQDNQNIQLIKNQNQNQQQQQIKRPINQQQNQDFQAKIEDNVSSCNNQNYQKVSPNTKFQQLQIKEEYNSECNNNIKNIQKNQQIKFQQQKENDDIYKQAILKFENSMKNFLVGIKQEALQQLQEIGQNLVLEIQKMK